MRVKAYIPAGHPDTVTQFSIATDLRKDAKAPSGVTRSKDGKVNVTFLEQGDIFVMLYTPVNASPLATIKLVRE